MKIKEIKSTFNTRPDSILADVLKLRRRSNNESVKIINMGGESIVVIPWLCLCMFVLRPPFEYPYCRRSVNTPSPGQQTTMHNQYYRPVLCSGGTQGG